MSGEPTGMLQNDETYQMSDRDDFTGWGELLACQVDGSNCVGPISNYKVLQASHRPGRLILTWVVLRCGAPQVVNRPFPAWDTKSGTEPKRPILRGMPGRFGSVLQQKST